MKKICFVLLVIGIVFILGCTQQVNTSPKSSVMPTLGSEDVKEATVTGAVIGEPESQQESEAIKEFTMTAKRFEFTPSTIEVNKGDKVKITVTSIDVTHGFSLPGFNINERLEPNQPVIIEFIADKTGEFKFRCNIPCGSSHSNMAGTLIVN